MEVSESLLEVKAMLGSFDALRFQVCLAAIG